MALIIVADDDELVVEVVRLTLEPQGHVVGALPDGRQVKRVVEAKQPDLLILDCSMPEVSGIQALREIRGSAQGYRIPILMLTARSGREDEEIAYRSGADDYLRKPFDPDELIAVVEALLGGDAGRIASPKRRPTAG